MDEKYLEQASALTDAASAAAVQRSALALQQPGAEECTDCGELIPAPRRAACPSAIRCIHCQSAFERLLALHAHA